MIEGIVARLVSRKPLRPEAEVQADIYSLLTLAGIGLDEDDVVKMESQVADGTRRRIDVEAGHVVIEVKKDLRVGNLDEYENQLAGYVDQRTTELDTRYVGILTDGTVWRLYHLLGGRLVLVSELPMVPQRPDIERLLVWLESVMATREQIKPTPAEIKQRLGADSPGHRLDHASLAALYEANKNHPEVKLKRELWAKLLRTAFGKQFTDDPALFINHTLLVVTAELIAHAAIGWDISPHGPLTPAGMTSGAAFHDAQINGVIEADFFDWVTQIEGGDGFVTELGRRIARFKWAEVEHDVLKILYESVIPTKERESLGEYYTPDWLADRVVHETITDSLNTRVADPSCGSGTFLFHAIRMYLDSADSKGIPVGEAIDQVTSHVVGMDVHPVAVTLARVTYLLSIGLKRLNHKDRGPLTIPVYLGDSVQWEQRHDLIDGGEVITVSTSGGDLLESSGTIFGADLVFPRSILNDASRFDRLVSEMADKALDIETHRTGSFVRSDSALARPIFKRHKITHAEEEILAGTFTTMRKLVLNQHNHIWGYYVRNLIRPLWLTQTSNRVDVLVGNPPWLRYSKMSSTMQDRYKALARPRNLLTGGLGASSRDLSTLFVVRAVEMYLRAGGHFAFVMPHGVMSRRPHTGFRTGKWMKPKSEHLTAAFGESWDLARATTGFPMVSCVIFGQRTSASTPLPTTTQKWVCRLPRADMPWADVENRLHRSPGTVVALDSGADVPTSPYKAVFRNGAILYPRVLLFVNEVSAGPLGSGAGRVAVESMRTRQEKEPWKLVSSLKGRVESTFIHPVYLGETVTPYRSLTPRRAVLPVRSGDNDILTMAQIAEYSGLEMWWTSVEATWKRHSAENDPSVLLDRIDYHGQLAAQFPIASLRVVYTKAGNTLTAAIVRDREAVIDHKLYWAPVASEDEAHYLCAIINSTTVLERVKPLQALGLFGGRDWDKNVFAADFPIYDAADELHRNLADLGQRAEVIAAAVDVSSATTFQAARKLVVAALKAEGVAADIEASVSELIPTVV